MLGIISILGLGFLLGIKHSIDADHIAAISTIVSKHKSVKRSASIGMFWGFGHTLSLLIAGLIILLLKIAIPEKIALSFELIAGIVLVVLGINVLIRIKKEKIHIHRHKHDGIGHTHVHSHALTEEHKHKHRSFFIGLIHGLAGSAALTLLVLATIDSTLLGLFYILIFGIGSIIGMIMAAGIMALPFVLFAKRLESAQGIFRMAAGSTSVLIGLNMIYTISTALF